jgi:hypothetical protein
VSDLSPVNSSLRRCGVPAMQKLLIDVLVAATAIPGGEFGGDYEDVMIRSKRFICQSNAGTKAALEPNFMISGKGACGSESDLRWM